MRYGANRLGGAALASNAAGRNALGTGLRNCPRRAGEWRHLADGNARAGKLGVFASSLLVASIAVQVGGWQSTGWVTSVCSVIGLLLVWQRQHLAAKVS